MNRQDIKKLQREVYYVTLSTRGRAHTNSLYSRSNRRKLTHPATLLAIADGTINKLPF